MSLIGTGIQTITDLSDKNYEDVSKKIISTTIFRGFSKIGALANLSKGQQYVWDYILNPFEDTFNFMVE